MNKELDNSEQAASDSDITKDNIFARPALKPGSKKKDEKEAKESLLVNYASLKSRKTKFFLLLLFSFFSVSIFIIVAYFAWLNWLPSVWNWGFNPTTWRGFLAFYATLLLAISPFLSLLIFGDIIEGIFKLLISETQKKLDKKIEENEQKQKIYIEKIEEHDKSGLISLITFSKLELENYYNIGLNQTQKSYRYSIFSMWIGFMIIMFGIISYMMPLPYINQNLVNGNFQILILGSGIVVELISGLFLWIYKSSLSQLKYFYNRQIFIHNSLLAFAISESMDNSDESKKIIIEKILEFGLNNK
ncbi:hypothetical protein [Fluviicola sp.]|uniref:TRADD-N-associated membrane domain-containing protein n=1 Tax=Fluviicola sp. TaxID=1917219 RepID=UPI0031DA0820